MSAIQIQLGKGIADGTIIRVDGVDVAGATANFALRAGADRIPTLELDLMILDGIMVEGEVKVIIPAATAEALQLLGWTPPEDASQPQQ